MTSRCVKRNPNHNEISLHTVRIVMLKQQKMAIVGEDVEKL
jgi:hypothetical protein